MVEIIPAVMPQTRGELEEKISSILGLVPTVQLDVMDGNFVPNTDWPYSEGGIKALDGGLPHVHAINYEIDLMVAAPLLTISDWIRAGATRLVVHIESIDKGEYEELIERSGDVEIGIALNPDTDNNVIESLVGRVDFLQFMGIARIGYQGETFDERVIGKIISLRQRHPGVTISVDGGVNFDIAPELIKAGANRLAVGSAIWKAEDPQDALKVLQSL